MKSLINSERKPAPLNFDMLDTFANPVAAHPGHRCPSQQVNTQCGRGCCASSPHGEGTVGKRRPGGILGPDHIDEGHLPPAYTTPAVPPAKKCKRHPRAALLSERCGSPEPPSTCGQDCCSGGRAAFHIQFRQPSSDAARPDDMCPATCVSGLDPCAPGVAPESSSRNNTPSSRVQPAPRGGFSLVPHPFVEYPLNTLMRGGCARGHPDGWGTAPSGCAHGCCLQTAAAKEPRRDSLSRDVGSRYDFSSVVSPRGTIFGVEEVAEAPYGNRPGDMPGNNSELRDQVAASIYFASFAEAQAQLFRNNLYGGGREVLRPWPNMAGPAGRWAVSSDGRYQWKA